MKSWRSIFVIKLNENEKEGGKKEYKKEKKKDGEKRKRGEER